MDIIELLAKNIYFVVIIAWFLYSLFTKKKAPEQKQQQNHPRPVESPIEWPWEEKEPQAEQRGTLDYSEDEDYVNVENYDDQYTLEPLAPSLSSQLGLLQSSLPEQVVKPTISIPESEQSKNATALSQSQRSKKYGFDATNINQTNIVQGIVWSQVLSKPRSKNPYRRMM